MYVGVQSLASIDLKPSLVSGTVPRIPGAPPETDPATGDEPGADDDYDDDDKNNNNLDMSQDGRPDDYKISHGPQKSAAAREQLKPPAPSAAAGGSKRDRSLSSTRDEDEGAEEPSDLSDYGQPARSSNKNKKKKKKNEENPLAAANKKKRRSKGPQAANAKDPWGEDEIKKLIRWKAQGKTHKEVGVSTVLNQPSCRPLFLFLNTPAQDTLRELWFTYYY
jgi:hypothetical protein